MFQISAVPSEIWGAWSVSGAARASSGTEPIQPTVPTNALSSHHMSSKLRNNSKSRLAIANYVLPDLTKFSKLQNILDISRIHTDSRQLSGIFRNSNKILWTSRWKTADFCEGSVTFSKTPRNSVLLNTIVLIHIYFAKYCKLLHTVCKVQF